jgi:hypothetical protein
VVVAAAILAAVVFLKKKNKNKGGKVYPPSSSSPQPLRDDYNLPAYSSPSSIHQNQPFNGWGAAGPGIYEAPGSVPTPGSQHIRMEKYPREKEVYMPPGVCEAP